ncbi:MAG: hypothetical protein QOG10_2649, partial [Kribbellaceae bacterium]|nr:hypothetical protein [Kribbellaceae bacterium]
AGSGLRGHSTVARPEAPVDDTTTEEKEGAKV